MKKRIITLILILALGSALVMTSSANNTKLVALTFDDGPNAKFTPSLLDALAERNVLATFFVVGYLIDDNMDIAQRTHDEGHQLANHSYNHPFFSRCSATRIKSEIDSTSALLTQITGETDFLLRAPYGVITSRAKSVAGAPFIQWSVDPGNGNMSTNEWSMYNNMVRSVKDGSIILLHDTNQKNLNVAIKTIDYFLDEGYEFVTLDELFRLKGITPIDGEVYHSLPTSVWETRYDETYMSSHWAYSSIQYVQQNGIMQGTDTGLEPNQYMTRAMAATILMNIGEATGKGLLNTDDLPKLPKFDDVPDGLWFSDAVNWAHENGYVNGDSASLYSPNRFITKQEYYAILSRFAAAELAAANGKTPVTYRDDVRIDDWASQAVNLYRGTGFSSLNDREIFRPLDFMTRAEAAELSAYTMQLILM